MEPLERGERGGVVLDGSAESSETGDIDAAIKTNQEANQVVDVKSGATDTDGGTEILEDGTVDGETQEQVDPNGEGAGKEDPNQLESFKADIKAEIAKLTEKPVEQKPMTDEDWAKLEQSVGAPRQTIEFFTNQSVKVVNKMMDYIDSKFAKFEVGDAIANVGKEVGFSDATRYRNEINEFLGDYDTKHWSNPALIKKAVIYARGLNAGKNLTKARTDLERNKKIAGPARPASPATGMKRTSAPALSGAHKEVAAIMGNEAEYNKFRTRPSRTIE